MPDLSGQNYNLICSARQSEEKKLRFQDFLTKKVAVRAAEFQFLVHSRGERCGAFGAFSYSAADFVGR
jgi:hypothetical protein